MPAGSSPLARGTEGGNQHIGVGARFIPAGAGNREWTAPANLSATVHPRWRGEQDSSAASAFFMAGSSPLARGTAEQSGSALPSFRFIPAGAGNSQGPAHRRPGPAVHPRWRGEQLAHISSANSKRGSSPLARGTGHQPQHGRRHRRFIPAGAGNRPPTATAPMATTVHPRWRGEQDILHANNASTLGSSPLARGTAHPPNRP